MVIKLLPVLAENLIHIGHPERCPAAPDCRDL